MMGTFIIEGGCGCCSGRALYCGGKKFKLPESFTVTLGAIPGNFDLSVTGGWWNRVGTAGKRLWNGAGKCAGGTMPFLWNPVTERYEATISCECSTLNLVMPGYIRCRSGWVDGKYCYSIKLTVRLGDAFSTPYGSYNAPVYERTLIPDVEAIAGETIDLTPYMNGACTPTVSTGVPTAFSASIQQGYGGASGMKTWQALIQGSAGTILGAGDRELHRHPAAILYCEDCTEHEPYGKDLLAQGSAVIRFENDTGSGWYNDYIAAGTTVLYQKTDCGQDLYGTVSTSFTPGGKQNQQCHSHLDVRSNKVNIRVDVAANGNCTFAENTATPITASEFLNLPRTFGATVYTGYLSHTTTITMLSFDVPNFSGPHCS